MAEPAYKRTPKTETSKTGPRSQKSKGGTQRAQRREVAKPEATEAPRTKEPAAEHTAPSCNIGFCPICLAVTAMQPLRPDVIEHLLVAGREFFLAAKAVIDARAEQFTGESGDGAKRTTRLEKIDIG